MKLGHLVLILLSLICYETKAYDPSLFNIDEDSFINKNVKNNKLIYGIDNRMEIEDYNSQDFIEKSQSVALRVPTKRLLEDRNDSSVYNFQAKRLKQIIPNICSNERFIDQYNAGDCSGFLVAPNILVTAGHCMVDKIECAKNKWVFGYKQGVNQFKKEDVYSCKKIVSQQYVYSSLEVSDYAVIELDRAVTNRKPLERRIMGNVSINTPLVTIGHPLGLPMKIVDGGRVTKMNEEESESPIKSFFLRANYFTTNLDVYSGNSGSPVFNLETGKVEGIVVQGAEDFVFNEKEQCLQSRHLTDSHRNSYEKIMRINRVPGI